MDGCYVFFCIKVNNLVIIFSTFATRISLFVFARSVRGARCLRDRSARLARTRARCDIPSTSQRYVTGDGTALLFRRKQETNALQKQNQKVQLSSYTIKDISYSHILSSVHIFASTFILYLHPPIFDVSFSHLPHPSSFSAFVPAQASRTRAQSYSATKSKCHTACTPRQARWSHGGNHSTKKQRMCSS